MQEALKHLNSVLSSQARGADLEGVQDKIASLNRRIKMVHGFMQAQALNISNPEESLTICQQLISEVRDQSTTSPLLQSGHQCFLFSRIIG